MNRIDARSAPEVTGEILDAEAMSSRLAGFFDRGSELRVVAARVLGRASAGRVVVEYQTSGPRGRGPVLIAKVHADRERARRLHALLVELHTLDQAGHECMVPRPVAYVPELGMSVYLAAAGRPLDELPVAEQDKGVVAAARWLSAFHGLKLHLDRSLDLTVEIRNLADWTQLVAQRHPAAAGAAGRLFEQLFSLAGRIEISTTGPIHKDFQYRHVLVDQGQAVVIDLDETRAGDPAFDAAHYCANLRLLAIRGVIGPEVLLRLESAFLQGFASRTGYQPDLRHDFFYAYTCVKIAKQLIGGRGPAPAPVGTELSRQLELILSEGLRCLPA
jgi:hypothetical protein